MDISVQWNTARYLHVGRPLGDSPTVEVGKQGATAGVGKSRLQVEDCRWGFGVTPEWCQAQAPGRPEGHRRYV